MLAALLLALTGCTSETVSEYDETEAYVSEVADALGRLTADDLMFFVDGDVEGVAPDEQGTIGAKPFRIYTDIAAFYFDPVPTDVITNRPPPGDELCRSSNRIKFAKCVGKEVDAGKCVKVYKDEGEYVGEEIDCDA